MPEKNFRVLIAGGGTGGHVVPALAIARQMRDAYGAEVLLLGTQRGLETKLVPEAGFPLELIQVGQLKNVSLKIQMQTLLDLPRGLMKCFHLLRSFRPQVVVGVGGYASGPAMMAAVLLRIPTLAFEPNAFPGLANRLVGKFVSAAAVNYEQTRRWFRKAEVTGIPVRPEFFALPRRTTISPHLLVFGGSQGARVLNEAMPKIIGTLFKKFPSLTVLHQSGARERAQTEENYRATGSDAYRWQVVDYLDDMPQRFADADLVLCRSGASTCAELTAAGKPSILVPFAQATDNHQQRNAEVLLHAGAARMVLESPSLPEHILYQLRALIPDLVLLTNMSGHAQALAHPDALKNIGAKIKRLAE
jgi:UDP-N-acetylglucosamine--N-acetylmuramyl-(pentapeptide) pyrophosphoryl-undecaprenol N-acetylglucosamine transferase